MMARTALAAAAVAVVIGTAVVMPPAASALSARVPTWGTMTVSATFGSEVRWTGSVLGVGPARRAELVVEIAGSPFRTVLGVEPPNVASGGLEGRLETPFGSLMPNTELRGWFRLTLVDGSVVDGPPAVIRYLDGRVEWRTRSGPIVTVHWVAGGDDFGTRALAIAEAAVADAGSLLGVVETEPIDFFIYGDAAAFRDILGPASRENVGGQAHPDIRTLFANIGAGSIDDPWVGIVIPHELTHLVFDSVVRSPYRQPPHWLNEGLAVYLSEGYSARDRDAVTGAAEAGDLMPLTSLAGQFPTAGDRFALAYAESVSAVDHLVAASGRGALVDLVQAYAAGVSDDEAFRAALGQDLADFEAGWLAALGIDAPIAFGPRPAPPGPLPAAWDGGSSPEPGGSDPATAPSSAPSPGVGDGPTEPGPDGSALVAGLVGALVLVVVIARFARRTPARR